VRTDSPGSGILNHPGTEIKGAQPVENLIRIRQRRLAGFPATVAPAISKHPTASRRSPVASLNRHAPAGLEAIATVPIWIGLNPAGARTAETTSPSGKWSDAKCLAPSNKE
jgi:hypothetical protein